MKFVKSTALLLSTLLAMQSPLALLAQEAFESEESSQWADSSELEFSTDETSEPAQETETEQSFETEEIEPESESVSQTDDPADEKTDAPLKDSAVLVRLQAGKLDLKGLTAAIDKAIQNKQIVVAVVASGSGPDQGLLPASQLASALSASQMKHLLPVVQLSDGSAATGPKYAYDFIEMYRSKTGIRPLAIVDPAVRKLGDWSYLTKDEPLYDSIEQLLEKESAQSAADRLQPVSGLDQVQILYRLYNPNSGEHFYTTDSNEAGVLLNTGWNYESFAWTSPKKGQPVYRLYNPNDGGDHHYTTERKEADHLVSVGWRDEGIAFQSATDAKKPVYRVYNPNAQVNNHHFTLDAKERSELVRLGWRDEGIGFQATEDVVSGRPISMDNYLLNGIGYSWKHVRLSGVHPAGKNWYLFKPDGTITKTEGLTDDGAGKKIYIQKDGTLAVNKSILIGDVHYHFGADARWDNAVDIEIERMCNQVYAKVGKDQQALYFYVVDEFTYKTREEHIDPPAGRTRQQNYAILGLSEKQGNCYCFAAALTALLRNAGYNADYIEGSVTYARGGLGPHGWVETTQNGGRYILDAQIENQMNHNGRPTRRGRFYMVPVGQTELNYVR